MGLAKQIAQSGAIKLALWPANGYDTATLLPSLNGGFRNRVARPEGGHKPKGA
jgi:hypothetical protein